MAKYKRQKVKRYRRSFYSRGTRIKKGIGIVVLVLAVLGAAWLAAPHVLDWATHTWYTVVKNRDLEAESASRAAASSEAAASSAVQEAASSQPEPEQPKELDGKAITGGSWAAVDVSTLADDAAIRAAAQQLKAQGADYGLVTLKTPDGSIHYASQVAAASGSIAGITVDPARIAALHLSKTPKHQCNTTAHQQCKQTAHQQCKQGCKKHGQVCKQVCNMIAQEPYLRKNHI